LLEWGYAILAHPVRLAPRDHSVQRLFSIFPNGWPGRGLLVLRLVAGGIFLMNGIAWLTSSPHRDAAAPAILGIAAAVLLLIGFCTPVGSILAVISQSWTLIIRGIMPETAILLLSISVAIAMLGPGAWSIDAILFGRKRLKIPD
jgi:putative oxidoreductase